MNDWCLSCSCTWETGCKRAAREAVQPKRRHSIVRYNRKQKMKRDLIAILKKLNEQVRQQKYYAANRERKLQAAKLRQSRQTLTTSETLGQHS